MYMQIQFISKVIYLRFRCTAVHHRTGGVMKLMDVTYVGLCEWETGHVG